MSIAITRKALSTHGDLEAIQSTPLFISLKLPIEEGQPIIPPHYRRRRIILWRRKEILDEMLDYILSKAKEKGGLLSLDETLQLILSFLGEHKKELLEYLEKVVRERMKNIIRIDDGKIQIIDKSRYIDLVINTYQDARDTIATLILKMLKKKHECKVGETSYSVRVLLSLSNIITIGKTCIELNSKHPRIIDIISILNTLIVTLIIRDFVLLKIMKKPNEKIVEAVLEEESRLYEEINQIMLDPDIILP